ncbi:hypothetical protein ACI2L1_10255 [Streptomyces sp. NPDC019531]|uniref:hypothetical protein n=1 Tax=Streptomyces sp. NPDC019531 TaxID=3365062 RepID=UPI00384FD19B
MRYRTRVTVPAALLGTAAALSLASPAHADPETATPGPETLGDSVFPGLGNDGYRVGAYHLDFAYDPTTRLVDATATLRRFRNASASTDDCIAVASEVSGTDQSGFLRDRLFGAKTPRMPGHPDWTVTPVTSALRTPPSSPSGPHDNSAAL